MEKEFGIYTEWSTNEKVAAEVAISASICGLRATVSMKGVGVNVASEPFQAFTYMGARGGIVLITADDPGCHSSHNEQDNRLWARQAYLPIFEPSSPTEAKEMARTALECSEEWAQPVMLRTTTQVSHGSSVVTLGEIKSPKGFNGDFLRDPTRWVNLPPNTRRMRLELIERLKRIGEAVEALPFNRIEGSGKIGIIVSGAAYTSLIEALKLLRVKDQVTVVKIGTPWPLPKKMIEKSLRTCEQVLVMEELEPFVEEQVAVIANKMNLHKLIHGKDYIPLNGTLSPQRLLEPLSKFLDTKLPRELFREGDLKEDISLPPRPPVLCAGCLHRSAFFAMNVVERRVGKRGDFIKPSDIGCYTLGYMPPLNAVDTNFSMGSSIAVSSGFSMFTGRKAVCTIGDSTFFHVGIPPLLNALHNGSNITVLILDNYYTAMTGHQRNPGSPPNETKIEDVVSALGIEFVRVMDPWDIGELVKTLEEAVRHEGVSVLVIRGPQLDE